MRMQDLPAPATMRRLTGAACVNHAAPLPLSITLTSRQHSRRRAALEVRAAIASRDA